MGDNWSRKVACNLLMHGIKKKTDFFVSSHRK